MAVKNALLMSQSWLENGSEYQQRIPSPSQASVREQIAALWEPGNQAMRNIFVDGLFNRVGLSYVRNRRPWGNPLEQFRKRDLPYGASVLEAQVKLIKGRQYLDDREELLKLHRPEIAQCVHSVNFAIQYPYSVNMMELRRAADSDYGLNEYVAGIMDAAQTSLNYDRYKAMMNLMAEYMTELGMYAVHADAITDDATAKSFLQQIREYSGLLQFPSGKYMAQAPDIQGLGMTTWVSDPSEIVCFMTPGTKSRIDVLSLAGTFHTELADVESKIILVDEFPMPDVFAVITTRDFFQVYNEALENGSFYNPETLSQNYYLTNTGIMSVSPFVPAIAFTTGAGTVDDTVELDVNTNAIDNVTLLLRNGYGDLEPVTAGTVVTRDMVNAGLYIAGELDATLTKGQITGATEIDGVVVAPNALVVKGIEITGTGAPVKNSRTFVDMNRRIHLQAGAFKSASGLTVTITYETAYTNPSGATPEPVEGTFSFEVAGENFSPVPGLSDVLNSITVKVTRTGTAIETISGDDLDTSPHAGGTVALIPQYVLLSPKEAGIVTGGSLYAEYGSSVPPIHTNTETMTTAQGMYYAQLAFSPSSGDPVKLHIDVETADGTIPYEINYTYNA